MKSLIALLLLLAPSVAVLADPPQSRLSITLAGATSIRVTIDDKTYICQDNSLVVDDLRPGYHTVRLYQCDKERWTNSSNGRLMYSGSLLVKSKIYSDVMINHFGKPFIDEQPISQNNYSDDDYRYNNIPDRDVRNNRPGNYSNEPQCMSNDAFALAQESIRKEGFENNKLSLARQIADNNYFSAAQVKVILQLFSFEDRKLEFAKYAYGRTVDRNNYFQVYDAFTFSKNKEDLSNYIQSYK